MLDVFISLHDTVVSDRGRTARCPSRPRDTHGSTWSACWSVRTIVVDTPEHADFFARFTAAEP